MEGYGGIFDGRICSLVLGYVGVLACIKKFQEISSSFFIYIAVP